jgi:MYXO-CTERM domain-containing protein
MNFRKPYWLASCQSMTVSVNSQSVNAVDSNGFLGVSRVWQVGDKVELTIPAEVQVSRLPDNQNAVAFTYGPLVLSAGLGTASMTTTGHAMTIAATMPTGIQDTIAINSGTTINSWIANVKTNLVQTAGKLEFSLKNTDSDSKLTFIPHYSRYQDRYGIYFKLAGTAGAAVPTAACPAAGGTAGTGGASSATGGSGGRTSAGGTSGVIGGATSTSANRGGSSNAAAGGQNNGGTMAVNLGGAGGVVANQGGANVNAGGSTVNAGGAAVSQGGTSSIALVSAGTGASVRTTTGGNGNPTANGGSAMNGTAGASAVDAAQSSSGCSCKLSDTRTSSPWSLGMLVGLGLIARRRNRRR